MKTQKQAAVGVIQREWHALQKRLDAVPPEASAPAVKHLRTHTPHIDAALEKEGATTV